VDKSIFLELLREINSLLQFPYIMLLGNRGPYWATIYHKRLNNALSAAHILRNRWKNLGLIVIDQLRNHDKFSDRKSVIGYSGTDFDVWPI